MIMNPTARIIDLPEDEQDAAYLTLLLDTDTEAEPIDPEDLDSFSGYAGGDFEHEVQQIADRLHEHYRPEGSTDVGGFTFGFDCTASRDIGGYMISVSLEGSMHLAEWNDIKNATWSREATGRDAAIAVARALDNDYQRILTAARDRGLLGED